MQDDNNKAAKNESTKYQQNYSIAQKEKLVRRFYDSQPISRGEFCDLYKLDLSSFRDWLRLYGDAALADGYSESHPTFATFLSESSASVKIAYTEYQELMLMKAKYQAVCSICG